MAYCTASDVRILTNLSTSDISDDNLTSIISYATSQLNNDISHEVIREKVEYIDNVRDNKIDGSNTTYYVKNWQGKYIADRNNDGSVSVSDIQVIKVSSDGVESTCEVSSISPNEGKFTLASAVDSSYSLYVTYKWSYADCYTPSSLVKIACILLSAAYAHAKINWGSAPSVSFGSARFLRDMDVFDKFYKQYLRIVFLINNRLINVKKSEVKL